MKTNGVPLILFFALGATGCAARQDVVPVPAITEASALVQDAQGRTVARASATESVGAVRIRIEAAGLAPGTYAAHIHEIGRCDPPAFDSAGGHWNPTARQHGSFNPLGPHLGDLPNLSVGADGRGTLEFAVAGASLGHRDRAMMDADGAALIIHASPDDYRTDPSGNSGARIACGTFG